MPPGDLAFIRATPGVKVVDVIQPCVVVIEGNLTSTVQAMRPLVHWSVKPAKHRKKHPWRG